MHFIFKMVLPAAKVGAFGATMPRGVPTARQPGFSPPLPFTSLRFFFRELSPKTPTSSEFTSRDPPRRGGSALPAAPAVGASPVHQRGVRLPVKAHTQAAGGSRQCFSPSPLLHSPGRCRRSALSTQHHCLQHGLGQDPRKEGGGARPRHLQIDGQAQWDGPTPRAHLLTGGDLGGLEAGGGLPPSPLC